MLVEERFKHPVPKKIGRTLYEKGPMSVTNLVSDTGFNKDLVSYHVGLMQRNGIVKDSDQKNIKKPDSSEPIVELTETGETYYKTD